MKIDDSDSTNFQPPSNSLAVRKNVLIVNLDNLGDLIFCTSLFEPIRSNLENTDLTLLCKRYCEPVSPFMEGIIKVYSADPFWDRAPGQKKGSLFHFLKTLMNLRREKFSLIINTSRSWKTAFVVKLIKSEQRIGFSCRGRRFLLDQSVLIPPINQSVLKGLATLLSPLHLKENASEPAYFLSRDRAQLYLQEHVKSLLPNNFVCLHAFAGSPRRCMALEKWFELANYFESKKITVLWFGGPQDMVELRRQKPNLDEKQLASYYAQGDAKAALAILSAARIFIGHDSGPLHVAAAFKVPCLGLYLPGEPKRTFPQGCGFSRMIYKENPSQITVAEIIHLIERDFRNILQIDK